TGFRVRSVRRAGDGIVVEDEDSAKVGPVDEIIVTTGFRPDLSPLRELRLGIDVAVESPIALAPLIDPNVHSCGTVRPHGAVELAHPEHDFYIVGMKSYGRAPTFLLLTGYEQVRSVAAALAGDWVAAREVQLVLPETGVCSLNRKDEPPALTEPDGERIGEDVYGRDVLAPTRVPVLSGTSAGGSACCG
ncbi:MAG TPA: flavoprotein, partial [Chloroflexota bacterium]|nr:flavoprotein [Chloroflexota bacterium]